MDEHVAFNCVEGVRAEEGREGSWEGHIDRSMGAG